MPLPRGLRLVMTARVLPGGLVLGGSPRVLLHVDPAALDELAAGDEAAARPDLARELLSAGLARPQGGVTAWRLSDVTAVIPVKDDAARLPTALASLAGLAEVIVVDDGSRDATSQVAREAGATVLRHEVPRGPAAARNAGLAAAGTPLVAFLDADAAAAGGWVEQLLVALSDPEVLLVAPRVLGLDRTGGGTIERYERVQSPLDMGPEPGLVGPGRAVAFVPAAALVVRRDDLLALGGFDAGMHVGEDVDLCARAARAGWLLRYEPEVVVRHDHRTEWRAFLRRRYQYGTSGAALGERHRDLVPATSAGGWLAAALLTLGAPRRSAVLGAAVLGGATAMRTTALLRQEGVPLATSATTALRAEVSSARRFVGTAARYTGLPLTAALAVRSRRARLLLAAGSVAMHVRDHRRLQPDLGLASFVALRVVEEASVGAGLWAACLRSRVFRPLDPRLALLPRRIEGRGLTWEAAPRD